MFGKRSPEVLVVGAGPVGLFTALSLAQRGVEVRILDESWHKSTASYALALHPRTLELLDAYGLARDLVAHGHRIRRMAFYEGDARVGDLDVGAGGGPFPFLLVVPQSELEGALERALAAHRVKVEWMHRAMRVHAREDGVDLHVARLDRTVSGYGIARTEWEIARTFDLDARWVVAADGAESFVGARVGASYQKVGPRLNVAVFEFVGDLPVQSEARVVFDDQGRINVFWPIGERRGRWTFQVPESKDEAWGLEHLQGFLAHRAPWYEGTFERLLWSQDWHFQARLAQRPDLGHVVLAGDAVHVTGPIGIQSMNLALQEAQDLGATLSSLLMGAGAPHAVEELGRAVVGRWRKLLGLDAKLVPAEGAPEWATRHADALLACMPGGLAQIDALAGQIGLRLG